jgi:hypothetical protein
LRGHRGGCQDSETVSCRRFGKSEMFMIANRTVGTRLSLHRSYVIVTGWRFLWHVFNRILYCSITKALSSSVQPFCVFQITLIAALSVLAKIRFRYAHTSVEIVRMRYGKIGHVVFALLNLSCNVFGCASMILTVSPTHLWNLTHASCGSNPLDSSWG